MKIFSFHSRQISLMSDFLLFLRFGKNAFLVGNCQQNFIGIAMKTDFLNYNCDTFTSWINNRQNLPKYLIFFSFMLLNVSKSVSSRKAVFLQGKIQYRPRPRLLTVTWIIPLLKISQHFQTLTETKRCQSQQSRPILKESLSQSRLVKKVATFMPTLSFPFIYLLF